MVQVGLWIKVFGHLNCNPILVNFIAFQTRWFCSFNNMENWLHVIILLWYLTVWWCWVLVEGNFMISIFFFLFIFVHELGFRNTIIVSKWFLLFPPFCATQFMWMRYLASCTEFGLYQFVMKRVVLFYWIVMKITLILFYIFLHSSDFSIEL